MKFVITIDRVKHAEFLRGNPVDPFTRDPISANDRVVVCAICGLVFLLSTWEYNGAMHCDQSNTKGIISPRGRIQAGSSGMNMTMPILRRMAMQNPTPAAPFRNPPTAPPASQGVQLHNTMPPAPSPKSSLPVAIVIAWVILIILLIALLG